MKKILHIVFLALLVLSPAGATAFPHSPDCAAECCVSAMNEGARPLQASPCCGAEDSTCGFEDGQTEGLFGKPLQGFTSAENSRLKTTIFSLLTAGSSSDALKLPHSYTLRSPAQSAQNPLYLTNTVFLC